MSHTNLLFLYTDEQRYDTLAAYGNTRIQMPNLNRFAETATVFDQAYVTQPVCTPSRSSLLTGLHPHANGCVGNNVPLPATVRCLPEMIAEDAYVTAHFGKWHLGDEIFAQHGFMHWRGIEDQYSAHYSEERDRSELSHYTRFLKDEHGLEPSDGMPYFHRGAAARLPEQYSKPAYLAREASRFIREHANDPFILYVNFLEPHMPFFGPRDGQYDRSEIPLPANFHAVPTEAQPLRTRIKYRRRHQQNGGAPLDTEGDWRELIARYWGLCSLVDTHVGAILDTLEECGLADNTVVVFTSDHGDMMGSHQLVAKTVMYQESVRVPLMIRLPGQREARRVHGPVSQIDVVPPLLDCLGQPIPSQLQGTSRKAQLQGESVELHEDVFIAWNDGDGEVGYSEACGVSKETHRRAVQDAVRTIITPDGWRFSCSPEGEHELYDLNTDPGETKNLASNDSYLPLARQLRERIVAWQQRVHDPVTLPDL